MSQISFQKALNNLESKMDKKFGFAETQFVSIDQRFVAIDQRFDAIDQRFVVIDQRFDAIDQRFVAVDQRFVSIERQLTKTNVALVQLQDRVSNIEHTLETKVATKQDVHMILDRLDWIVGEVQNFSRKAIVQDYRLQEVEPKIKDHEQRISALEKRPPYRPEEAS